MNCSLAILSLLVLNVMLTHTHAAPIAPLAQASPRTGSNSPTTLARTVRLTDPEAARLYELYLKMKQASWKAYGAALVALRKAVAAAGKDGAALVDSFEY